MKRNGNYRRKASWFVTRYGKYRRKASWIVKRYDKCGRKVGWIVKWSKIMEERQVGMWNDMENMEEM